MTDLERELRPDEPDSVASVSGTADSPTHRGEAMTDLERVREALLLGRDWGVAQEETWTQFDESLADLDAHLKEDADWHKTTAAALMQAERELAELREDRDRLKSNLLALDTAAVKRYDELREAVRRWYIEVPPVVNEGDLDRLRQLIEEKE